VIRTYEVPVVRGFKPSHSSRRTRASEAAAMLRAEYRWMLTGTPVTNTLEDLYGQCNFQTRVDLCTG
jgi:hypothetical protein